MSPQWGSKIISRIGVPWTHSQSGWVLPLFDSVKWSCYQKQVNQTTLDYTTLWNLALLIFKVFAQIWLDESNSWTILALYETSLNNSIDSDSFFVMEDYLHLIQKDSYTYMHGLAVYVKEESVQKVAWDLSLENSANSYFYFWLVLLHLVPYFFFLYQSPSSALCMVYDAMMRFSQSTHLPMYLFLETLTPIIRAS